MGKQKVQSDNGTPLSKFAQKLAAEADGSREPFEFKSVPREVSSQAAIFPRLVSQFEPIPRAQKQFFRVLAERECAVVRRIKPELGCMFLETAEGESVFLRIDLLNKHNGNEYIRRGYVIDCMIAENPNGRGLRVTEIFSVTPPPE